MRLFLAVLPPAPVLRELAVAVDPLLARAGADALRWTAREGWHLTLAFLGEVDEGTLPELTRRMALAARRHTQFTLRLTGGGRFGDRALWTGVADGTEPLSRLAASVAAGARRTGIAVDEDRAFRAHLTLARGRGATSLSGYADDLAGFESAAWRVDRFELVRSHPPTPGVPGAQPRYETLCGWSLGR